jgi:hypothetical protein
MFVIVSLRRTCVNSIRLCDVNNINNRNNNFDNMHLLKSFQTLQKHLEYKKHATWQTIRLVITNFYNNKVSL